MPHPANGTIAAPGALDDLALFVAVAQKASFVRAARDVRLGASSVSRAVARLEEQLGVVLLRRTSRKVVLTDEGQQLLQVAAPHVEGLARALAQAAEQRAEPSGVVRVTAPAYTGATRIARALAAFCAAHPQIRVELDVTNTIHDLLADGFDFAIRVGPIVDTDFVVRHLWRGEFGLFATRELVRRALGGRTVVGRAGLEGGDCVTLRDSSVWRFRDDAGRVTEIAPGVRFAVNDPRGVLEVARQGLGIALAPLEAVDDKDALIALTTELGRPEPIDLFVVYPARRQLPRRVRLAIDWLADRLPSPRKARADM